MTAVWFATVVGVGFALMGAPGPEAAPTVPAAGATTRAAPAGPLAALPSPPGPHVERLKALGDNAWLALGAPAPDPTWGRARGRSWTARMAFAPDLGGAFLFGEGVHGWHNAETGRYMDDLWFYDVNAHRWVCAYPGIAVGAYRMIVNQDGFEATPDGRPVAVATMVHGYEMTTYDPDTRRFMSMPCPGAYWGAIKGRREFLAANRGRLNDSNASPWFFDVSAGRWDRRRTAARTPASGFGDGLIYLPPHRKTFFYRRGGDVWYYDAAKNDWSPAEAKGPQPPFGIDFTACYDPKRDRIYLGGGSYPVAQGDNALWIYDLKTNTWVDPKPKGKPCGGSNSYATNIAVMHYDSASNVVVLLRHSGPAEERGVYVYDPDANEWSTATKALPPEWRGGSTNAFYDTELNAHVFHIAGDSRDDGVVLAYRLKRAAK